MEEIKPKKERRFLKNVGKIAGTLLQEFVLGLGRKFIGKKIDNIGNKRQALLIFLALFTNIAFASIDSIPYPIKGNKQRLGWQTTGDGLVYRGRANDTITKPSNYANKDIKAYLLLDTVNNVLYNYIASKGGWVFSNADSIVINNNFTQPVDSLFFNTSVPTNNVDEAKMRWDSEKATVVLGMNDNVANELGFKNFWLVKNQTGSTITKGSIVYANGTVGASGRLTVAKFIANGTIDAKYLLGITAHDLSNGEDGYVISYGKIRQVNTDTFANGSILYPSPTVAGVWTDVEPKAPNINMPIGFCINSSSNNGTIAIRVASGYKVHELQDVDTTGLSTGEGLVYNGSYFVASDGNLILSTDTSSMLTNYLRAGVAANTYLPLTGGTLTGSLTGTTGTFTGLNINNTTTEGILTLQGYDNNTATKIDFKTTGNIRRQIIVPTSESNMQFRTSTVGGTQGGYSFYTRRNPNAENLAFNIDVDGNSQFYGTLGVTGATTLSNLAGTGTRMVVAGSDGALSTQSLGVSTFSAGTTGFTPSTATSGAITLAGTLAIANGGTGATSAATARTNLGATVRGANTFILTDIGAISFLRYNADNTVSQRAADGMRSDLGGTTIGQSMFTLTNPSAVTFPRFNADNTVSSLNATDFRTAIGAGTGNGNGTVTNVTGTLPISVANGTTTPSITIANASTTASGVVTTGTQSMAGNKTFTGDLATSQAFSATGFSTLTGGASIGTMATESTLTHVLGVNSSNAIGELGLGVGMSVGSGILSVQAAGASQSGLVTSTTQSFGGNKTFTGTIKTDKYIAVSGVTVITGNYTILDTDTYIVCNGSGTITLTMPSGSAHTGREITIKTTQLFTVISNASNIIGMQNSSITSTGILPATDGAWGTFVYDGTNWMQMAAGVPNQ